MEQLNLSWDAEGYPTEGSLNALEQAQVHNADEARELIRQVREIWWMPDFGFIWDGNKKLTLHTGGWSGNEDIIRALKNSALKGNYFWTLYWKAHFVGGHYHFEIK
jgi:hypothetical protein